MEDFSGACYGRAREVLNGQKSNKNALSAAGFGHDLYICSRLQQKSEEPEQDTETAYTIDNIRDYVIGVDEPVELGDGTMQPLINFDNAATTPALKPVMVQSLSFSKQIIE